MRSVAVAVWSLARLPRAAGHRYQPKPRAVLPAGIGRYVRFVVFSARRARVIRFVPVVGHYRCVISSSRVGAGERRGSRLACIVQSAYGGDVTRRRAAAVAGSADYSRLC